MVIINTEQWTLYNTHLSALLRLIFVEMPWIECFAFRKEIMLRINFLVLTTKAIENEKRKTWWTRTMSIKYYETKQYVLHKRIKFCTKNYSDYWCHHTLRYTNFSVLFQNHEYTDSIWIFGTSVLIGGQGLKFSGESRG